MGAASSTRLPLSRFCLAAPGRESLRHTQRSAAALGEDYGMSGCSALLSDNPKIGSGRQLMDGTPGGRAGMASLILKFKGLSDMVTQKGIRIIT